MPGADAVAAAIDDVAALRRACAAAGLLDAPPSAAAAALAGGADRAERLRRDLLLADALLRNRVAREDAGLRHVVVFGGTKVGKSSVVNILAKTSLAAVSPEGGYTRLPSAFAAVADPLAGLALAFRDAPPDAFRIVPREGAAIPPEVVLWDTPDCDSVGAERYLAGLVEALSLADLIVYVTSIEKYAVAALVDWVFALHDAGFDLLQCLNKTPRRDRAPVLARQRDEIFPRMARERGTPPFEMPAVALGFMAEGEEADLWNAALHPEADELRAAVLRRVAAADVAAARLPAAADAAQRIGRVLAVARALREARATWEQATRDALAAFVRRYEQQYLAAGEVIEPFLRLNVEIMALLDYDNKELNAALQFVRRLTTLPTRIVVNVGRQIYSALVDRDGTAGWSRTVAAGAGVHQRACRSAQRARPGDRRRVQAVRPSCVLGPARGRVAGGAAGHARRLRRTHRRAIAHHEFGNPRSGRKHRRRTAQAAGAAERAQGAASRHPGGGGRGGVPAAAWRRAGA